MSAPGWPLTYTVDDGGTPHQVRVRFAVRGPLGDAYPAGVADLELDIRGLRDAEALRNLGERILRENPACRRLVLPVPAGDLDAVAFAEDAGFRYVVDVDVLPESGNRSSGDRTVIELSLLVMEPSWVADQPTAVGDLPL